jgi:hypothetical protein
MEVDNPHTSGAPSTVTSDARDDEVCQVVDEDCIITGRSGSLALSDVSCASNPATPKPAEGAFTLTVPRCCSPVPTCARELRREEVGQRPLQGQHRLLRQLLLLRVRRPRERVQGVGRARAGHAHGIHVARHAGGGQGGGQGSRGSGGWERGGRGRWACRVDAALVVRQVAQGERPPERESASCLPSAPSALTPRWQALEQVYPVEAPQPAGIASSITLRPYQTQSLAFMLAVENSTDPSLVGQRPAERNEVHLMRDAVRGSAMTRAERHAGAYKVEIKNGPAPPTRPVRGGWLCDEVGMGDAAWSEAPRGGPRRLSAPDQSRGRLSPTVLQPWSLPDREPPL